MKRIGGLIHLFVAVCSAMIGYTIHHSLCWAIVDFVFYPIAWVKWLICHEVSLSIIKSTFSFLTQ